MTQLHPLDGAQEGEGGGVNLLRPAEPLGKHHPDQMLSDRSSCIHQRVAQPGVGPGLRDSVTGLVDELEQYLRDVSSVGAGECFFSRMGALARERLG